MWDRHRTSDPILERRKKIIMKRDSLKQDLNPAKPALNPNPWLTFRTYCDELWAPDNLDRPFSVVCLVAALFST